MSATDLFVSSQPTLKLGGREDGSLSQGLLSLRVHERVDGLYHCEFQVGNWGLAGGDTSFLYFDRQTLDFGKSLEVSVLGSTLFKGTITGLEAGYPEGSPPVFSVLAEDRFQELRMTRRTRTFENVSDADVMQQIASDHGLSPSVNASGPTHKVLAQVAQSDLAFLRERARAVGAELWLSDTTLNAALRSSRAGASALTLVFGNELREFTVLADLTGQCSSVVVSGWDVAGKSAISESAGDSDLGSELGSTDSGASILSSALKQRKESVVTTVPVTSAEAHARAKATFASRARRFVTGQGLARTDARLRVGVTVTLQGLGPLFEGDYYVTEVKHEFDLAYGLRTEFAVERPGLGRPQP